MSRGDTLNSILNNLKNKSDEVRLKAAKELSLYVEAESRDRSGESFSKFMDDLHRKIFDLVNAGPHPRMGAILAIDHLIDVDCEENEYTKITRFANYLRNTLSNQYSDQTAVQMVAKALGRLARVGASGTLTAEWVEFEAKRALEWLQHKEDAKRYAAVLVLRELADNAPTLFYAHVNSFLEFIWIALRDSNLTIREGAGEALRAVLQLMSERESRWRVQWYYSIFEQVQKGFKNPKQSDALHGSLIAVGELLRNTGEFMMVSYDEVCTTILKHRDHKDRHVKRSVIALIPSLARFHPEGFNEKYLDQSINYLISVIKEKSDHRPTAYIAIGELALAVGDAISRYLDRIYECIREGLTSKSIKKPIVTEALVCIGMLGKTFGERISERTLSLLDQMFSAGLNPVLISSLQMITENASSLLSRIQERLLDLISLVLARTLYRASGTPSIAPPVGSVGSPGTNVGGDKFRDVALSPSTQSISTPIVGTSSVSSTTMSSSSSSSTSSGRPSTGSSSSASMSTLIASSELVGGDQDLIILALQTLGSFNMTGHSLTEFIRECVFAYLDDDNPAIRKEAAKTSCKLLVASEDDAPIRGHLGLIVGEVLEKLLTVGISDPDSSIRHAVLASLDSRFDFYLSLAENLRSLFIALNDEVFEIREVTIAIIGRLSTRNPAYVLPSLRKSLLQLLTELQFSTDSRNKEESAHMLGHLIRGAPRLIKPYVSSILNVLLERIRDSNPAVSAAVLMTVGELSIVGSEDMIAYIDRLLPLVMETLQDQSSNLKRATAVRTLGQLVQSTGYVITPYVKYPQLLKILLTMLKHEESWATRREIIKVLGIIGAIDPHKHRMILQQLQPSATIAQQNQPSWIGAATAGVEGPNTMDVLPGMGPSSEDYYPTVAINALMKILRDPSFTVHHNAAIEAVMFIFNALKLRSIPFLPQVMPIVFGLIRTCESGLRKSLFQQLALLVSIVKQHIKAYLLEFFALIKQYWDPDLLIQIITLLEEMSNALNEEFKPYLPELIPQLLNVLQVDLLSPHRTAIKVLHAFEVFGRHLDDYLYLVIPAIVRLFEHPDASEELRLCAIDTLGRLSRCLNFSEYASRIIHPLCRILSVSNPQLRNSAMDALCCLIYQLGTDYAIFIPMVSKVLAINKILHPKYEDLVQRLLRYQELPVDGPVGLDREEASSFPSSAATGSAAAAASPDDGGLSVDVSKKMHVNQQNLKKAWEAEQRSTKEDWMEWIRRFSVELLRESPSPALRSCSALASVYYPLARELFNAGFVSCWTELYDHYQEEVVRALEMAFSSPNLPTEVLQTLLNLAEFMEHDDKPLPIDIRALGALAEKCQTHAKALHYKEIEFQLNPASTIEALISINDQLQQHEAAMGILIYAQKNHSIELKESWYEKLQRWQDAYDVYVKRELEQGPSIQLTLGRMRCLEAMGEWERLYDLCLEEWHSATAHNKSIKQVIASMGSSAAWNLQRWEFIEECVSVLDHTAEGSFYRVILAILGDRFSEAQSLIDVTRELLDAELSALVNESYNRAYEVVIRVQQLSELEEIIAYKKLGMVTATNSINATAIEEQRARIRQIWTDRLKGCSRNVEYWGNILAVRKLVVRPENDVDVWLKFASLCRKSGKLRLSQKTLDVLLGDENPQSTSLIGFASIGDINGRRSPAKIAFSYFEHMWASGSKREAYNNLSEFTRHLAAISPSQSGAALLSSVEPNTSNSGAIIAPTASVSETNILLAKCHLRMCEWLKALHDSLDDDLIRQILESLRLSTRYNPNWYKSWHAWALMNSEVVAQHEQREATSNAMPAPPIQTAVSQASGALKTQFIVNAIEGFFKSISLTSVAPPPQPAGADASPSASTSSTAANMDQPFFSSASAAGSASMTSSPSTPPTVTGSDLINTSTRKAKVASSNLQDILRLITLWFQYGSHRDVEETLNRGFDSVSIDTWLQVIPQIIARINTNTSSVRRQIHSLLAKIGRAHPQALIYPLTVCTTKGQTGSRKSAAEAVLNYMRKSSSELVEQALLVSHELIRVAILWNEMWHEGLEEASRLYFGDHNVDGMFAALAPLHKMMERAETLREISFQQAFGRELTEALDWCRRFLRSRRESDLNQAWDLYYHVFRRINKQLTSMTNLELQYCSPLLMDARNLELAVPGTYQPCAPIVNISSFVPTLSIIASKQRPRKLTIIGSDRLEYKFLLKGHEDLRQDERVMQLFGLVNTLLTNTGSTSGSSDLNNPNIFIERYPVIPLSSNAGIIGWLTNCDTFHALIRDYRESRKILLNIEHRLMVQMAPDYDSLTLIQKVEVFEHALESTTGQDLYKVLWLKSRNSEVWLERRTNYTRSLAVMSMVGHVLGLGDRHPSNLMLDRFTGKVIHIDFGDMFEVAMNREKFPEQIPFRLTRMLINAMEVSGIEGNFRSTCEHVMRVLRENKDSVMAMLEAFVHDPLINWRLLGSTASPVAAQGPGAATATANVANSGAPVAPNGVGGAGEKSSESKPRTGSKSSQGGTATYVFTADTDPLNLEKPRPRSVRERDLRQAMVENDATAPDILNEKAISVINRIRDKLTGRDFDKRITYDVPSQVDRLIKQATSHENLCQCYVGWCPFW